MWIFKIDKNRILFEANFWSFYHPETFPGVLWGPTKMWFRFQPFWRLLDTYRHPDTQAKYMYTFYLLFQFWTFSFCLHCKRKPKKFREFSNLMKIEFCWRQIFEILIIHKPSWGHVRSRTKCGPHRFSRFNVYWTQTDSYTLTDKQSIYTDI